MYVCVCDRERECGSSFCMHLHYADKIRKDSLPRSCLPTSSTKEKHIVQHSRPPAELDQHIPLITKRFPYRKLFCQQSLSFEYKKCFLMHSGSILGKFSEALFNLIGSSVIYRKICKHINLMYVVSKTCLVFRVLKTQ